MPKATVRTKLRTRKSAAKRLRRFLSDGTAMVRQTSNQHLAARKSKRMLAHSGRAKRLGKQHSKNLHVLVPNG